MEEKETVKSPLMKIVHFGYSLDAMENNRKWDNAIQWKQGRSRNLKEECQCVLSAMKKAIPVCMFYYLLLLQ